MNWWNESIGDNTYENFKKKNLIHKYTVSNEKDLESSGTGSSTLKSEPMYLSP